MFRPLSLTTPSRRPLRFGLALLFVAASACLSSSSVAAGPEWVGDLATGRKLAKQFDRPLLIHIYGNGCIPCMVMENTVLNRPDVRARLKNDLVAVKILGNNHLGLCRQYGVTAYPSDILLTPAGDFMTMTSGRVDLGTYQSMLQRTIAKYASMRKPKPVEPPVRPAPETEVVGPTEPETPPVVPEVATNEPIPNLDRTPAEATPERTPDATVHTTPKPRWESEQPRGRLGLEGYSPIDLVQYRRWRAGDPKFAFTYNGVTYRLRNKEQYEEFQERAHQYAPRLHGCDPVLMAERQLPQEGDIRYGAFFDGELYLFATPQSRATFKTAPYRYSRTRHVILDEADRMTLRR